MNLNLSMIVWPIVAFAFGIIGTMIAQWAKKGSSTCEVHQTMMQSITELTIEIKHLIVSQQELLDKHTKSIEAINNIRTDVAVLFSKLGVGKN